MQGNAPVEWAGFTVVLDDFGAKYSNLCVLKESCFDQIKIDRSLVENLESNRRDQIIVKNVMNMCRELCTVKLLAEGIETGEQKERLLYYHCEYGQGYYFHRPMPQEQFEELLLQGDWPSSLRLPQNPFCNGWDVPRCVS